MKAKIFMTTFLLFLIMPFSLATNMTITVVSNESIDVEQNIKSENVSIATNLFNVSSFEWYINGYPGRVPVVVKRGLSLYDLAVMFEKAIDYIFGLRNREPNEYIMNIIYNLARIFVNKFEYEKTINYLNMRIEALEKAVERINRTAYCQGKIDVMIEYNLSYVKCGNTTYYRFNHPALNYNAIGITPVD